MEVNNTSDEVVLVVTILNKIEGTKTFSYSPFQVFGDCNWIYTLIDDLDLGDVSFGLTINVGGVSTNSYVDAPTMCVL